MLEARAAAAMAAAAAAGDAERWWGVGARGGDGDAVCGVCVLLS
jgi:hypothetical protein